MGAAAASSATELALVAARAPAASPLLREAPAVLSGLGDPPGRLVAWTCLTGFERLRSARQSVSDHRIAGLGAERAVAASHHDEILPTRLGRAVGHRRGLGTGGQP